MGPEMSVAVAQVAVPAAAGPGFDLHAERLAVGGFVAGPELLEQRGKGYIQRRLYMNLLVNRQGQVFEGLFSGNHHFSLGFGSRFGPSFESAEFKFGELLR